MGADFVIIPVLIIMVILSVCDIRDRNLPIIWIVAGLVMSIIVVICDIRSGNRALYDVVMAVIPGVLFCIYSGKHPDKLGTGDGPVLWIGALITDMYGYMYVLGIAFAMIFLIYPVMVRKTREIPFVPFFTVGLYIVKLYLIIVGG